MFVGMFHQHVWNALGAILCRPDGREGFPLHRQRWARREKGTRGRNRLLSTQTKRGSESVAQGGKTRSRHNYVPLFLRVLNMVHVLKSTTLTGFLLSHLKNNHPFSMVFAWLWGYEFAVLLMFSIHVQHTRLKKKRTFLSQHVEAKSASFFNVFAVPQFVRQTNANTQSRMDPFTSRVTLGIIF